MVGLCLAGNSFEVSVSRESEVVQISLDSHYDICKSCKVSVLWCDNFSRIKSTCAFDTGRGRGASPKDRLQQSRGGLRRFTEAPFLSFKSFLTRS